MECYDEGEKGNFLVHELKEGEQRRKRTRCPLKGPRGKKFRLYSKIKGKGKMIERLNKVLILLFSFRTALSKAGIVWLERGQEREQQTPEL